MARRSGHPGDAVRSTNQDRPRSGGSTSRGAGQTGRFGAADNKDQPGAYPPSPVPFQAPACCHGGVHTGRHKIPPTGSSEHHRYVGRPDRGHRGTARWPPTPVKRPGDPVTVRPDRRKHTRTLAHRADGHLRPIVGPGTEHVPAARVVHPPKLDIARQMPGAHRSGPRPISVHHSRSVPSRMQAEQCGRVNASASGRGGAPGPLPHRHWVGAFACKERATARRCRTTGGRAVPSAPTPVP